jgi:hypothetical protein
LRWYNCGNIGDNNDDDNCGGANDRVCGDDSVVNFSSEAQIDL